MAQITSQQLPANPKTDGMNWKVLITGIVIGVVIVLIAVIGTVLYKNAVKKEPVQKVSTPIQKTATPSAKTSTESAQKSETTDWKVYTHKELSGETTDRFTFSYPADWKLDTSGDGGGFPVLHNGSNTKYLSIGVYDGSIGDAAGGINAAAERNIESGNKEKVGDLIVGGKNAIRLKSKSYAEEVVLIDHGKNYILLMFTHMENNATTKGQLTPNEKDILTNILSTFEFLE